MTTEKRKSGTGLKAVKVFLMAAVVVAALLSAFVSRLFGLPIDFAPLPTKQMPPSLIP